MSSRKFITYARGYGVDISEQVAKDLKILWLQTFPEMEQHLRGEIDEEFTNRNVIEYCRDNLAENEQVDNINSLQELLTFKGLDSNEIYGIVSSLRKYISKTASGRIKKNSDYCAAANYAFQGLAADGAKVALWEVYKAGYVIVNFVHDELIIELPLNSELPKHIQTITDLMVKGMKTVIKSVDIKAEPALMISWHKKAEAIYTADKKLLIWTADIIQDKNEAKLSIEDLLKKGEERNSIPVFDKKGEMYGWQLKTSVINY